ncbi:solute carrier organic anion transporter family member 2A1-like isoform X2 [Lineus longissimus]
MDKAVFQKPARCGLGKCHPPCLQVFKNIQSFTFFLCIFAVMSGMFPMYLVSQITTIEKHFGMPSQRSGMIVSAGEIGFLITVVFVGHFLNTSHRPRVLAGCAFTIGLSSILMTLPFFIYGTPHKHDGSQTAEELSISNSGQLCQRNQSQLDLLARCDNETGAGVGNGNASFGIFLFAAILSGCGATGLWSIGIAFLDDNAGKKEAALYIGMMFCLRSIAPVFGLMFGAGVSHISVDLQDHHLSPEHSSWIGAWWIGFLTIGVITVFAGLPLLFYPKQLPKAIGRKASTAEPNLMRERSRSIVERAAEESKTLAISFPKSVWKLLRNSVFLVMITGTMFDAAGGVGYMAFGPKYIESQFRVDTFTANTITAGIVLSSALGMGFSGLLTSRIKKKLNDLFLRAVIALAVCYTLFLGMMSFGCQEVQISGYTNTLADMTTNSSGSFPNINETCHQCYCPEGQYEPVCGSNGVTYYSPCQAGCDAGGSDIGYSGCDCVGGNLTSTSGACPSECGMIIPYAVCLIVLSFFTSLAIMPFVMVSIRCVNENDKSLALALLNIAVSLGILPVPVLYGSLLDSLCLVTESTSSCNQDESGVCLVYDNDATRYSLHGLTFGIRFVSPLLYILCWYLSRNMVFAGDETDEQNQKMQELNNLEKEKEKENDGEIIEPETLKAIIAV